MNYYSSAEIIKHLNKEGYKISQRTFTYYASEKKILPQPVIVNNKSKYNDLHIEYLKALLILKEKGSTLEEIKKELDKLNQEELTLISVMYQPFSSKEIIEDTKNIYNSISSANLDLYQSQRFINQQNDTLNFNKEMDLYNINNIDISNQIFSTSDCGSSVNNARSNFGYLYSNKITKQEDTKSVKKHRTIINENIIIETTNISSQCLKEIIYSIEEIYNKHKGDVI